MDIDATEANSFVVTDGLDLNTTEADAFDVVKGLDLDASGGGFGPQCD